LNQRNLAPSDTHSVISTRHRWFIISYQMNYISHVKVTVWICLDGFLIS